MLLEEAFLVVIKYEGLYLCFRKSLKQVAPEVRRVFWASVTTCLLVDCLWAWSVNVYLELGARLHWPLTNSVWVFLLFVLHIFMIIDFPNKISVKIKLFCHRKKKIEERENKNLHNNIQSLSSHNLLNCDSKRASQCYEIEDKGEVKRKQQPLGWHSCFFKFPVQSNVFSSAC